MTAITAGKTSAQVSVDHIHGDLPVCDLVALARKRASPTTTGDHPPAPARTARRVVTRHPSHPSPVTAPSDSSEEADVDTHTTTGPAAGCDRSCCGSRSSAGR